MKNRLYNYTYYWQLIFLVAVILLGSACQDEQMDPPVITGVINYEAAPNDTVVTTIQTGQWVVLLGKNLSTVSHVNFGSVPATINTALFAEGSLVVQLPDIPFESVPADQLNIVTAISEGGMTTFNINIIGEPMITRVRSTETSPNDTLINVIYPGSEISLIGFNLKGATEIAFQGIAADLSKVVYTDTSAIVQVPADLSGSNASLANTITYITDIGAINFSIKIVGPPVISSISLEVPQEGDMVSIYGYNFVSIESLIFAGTEITEYEVSADESSLSFVAPALTQGGPAEITTLGGAFATPYNVKDVMTGALSNFEWDGVFNWDWWAATLAVEDASLNEGWINVFPEFAGNGGIFLVMKTGFIPSGGGAEWETAVRIPEVEWLPPANIVDPVDSWALKFEMNVPQAWNGSALVFKTESEDYVVRYEPWQVFANKTVDFATPGWQTVVIPLSMFRGNDSTLGEGKGDSVTSLSQLLGDDGKGSLRIYPHNYGADESKTIFFGAFDNFRVVRQ
nr:glycan-binding surface protein [uncultured Draconibacterium sp.]